MAFPRHCAQVLVKYYNTVSLKNEKKITEKIPSLIKKKYIEALYTSCPQILLKLWLILYLWLNHKIIRSMLPTSVYGKKIRRIFLFPSFLIHFGRQLTLFMTF